jgi:pilus assembly protein CpaE
MNVLIQYASDWKKPHLTIENHNHDFSTSIGSLLKLQKVIETSKVQYVFLIGFKEEQKTISDLKKIVKNYSQLQIAIFSPQPKSEFLLECMKIGLTEIFTQLTKNAIAEIIERFQKKLESEQKNRPLRQYTLGILSAKGGDGASYLAANFAASLAKDPSMKVLLVDLSLPFGDLDMYVTNKKSTYDFVDFTNAIDRLDEGLIESMVQKIHPNLHFISSPKEYEKVVSITVENINPLIDLLKPSYDYLIFDIGSTIDPMIIHIVEKLNRINFVLTKNLPSVRQASQKMDLLESACHIKNNFSIIINNKDEVSDLNLSNIVSALDRSIEWEAPFDGMLAKESLLKSKSAVDINQTSSFSLFIFKWSQNLLGIQTKNTKSSIWQRFKKTKEIK